MRIEQLLSAAITMALATTLGSSLFAGEVRFFEKDGITYRETRETIRRPVSETEMRPSTRTVYRQERTLQWQETTRTWWTPVTEYHSEFYLVGRWNPFVKPCVATRFVPCTRWQQRTEVVQVPTTCHRLVPEIQTVHTPVTTRRIVSEEVIRRVAVDRPQTVSTFSAKPVLQRVERIGGVARLDNDPPRHGVSTAWRAATSR